MCSWRDTGYTAVLNTLMWSGQSGWGRNTGGKQNTGKEEVESHNNYKIKHEITKKKTMTLMTGRCRISAVLADSKMSTL